MMIRAMTEEEHSHEARRAIERVKVARPELLTPEQWDALERRHD